MAKTNRAKMREIANMYRNTASQIVYETMENIIARVTGQRDRSGAGSTPIGLHRSFLHGLLLGNWRLTTQKSFAFNPSSYIINRGIMYDRLMSFVGPSEFALGKTFYLTNSAPYAAEIDEASGKKHYQHSAGILPDLVRSFNSGGWRKYRRRLQEAGGFKVEMRVVETVFKGQSVFYADKKRTDGDKNDEQWRIEENLLPKHQAHPFHINTTADKDEQLRAFKRERWNATRRYAKALAEHKDKLGLVTHRDKTKKDDGKGNK